MAYDTEYENIPQNTNIHLGDRVSVLPSESNGYEDGTVCYIHPNLRYYVVALDLGYREAFKWGYAR